MKKNFLFVVLAVAMLSFAGCNRNENPVCEYPNVIITGILSASSICPPDMLPCWGVAVLAVVNDRGIFALVETSDSFSCSWEGLWDSVQEGNRIISICGTIVRDWEDSAYNFYSVSVSRIIR